MDTKESMEKLIQVLDEFSKLDREMPVQTILSFLIPCSTSKPIPIKQIAARAGMQQSSASRNVMAHTDINRQKGKGHDTLRTFENPMFRVEKLVELTQKGELLRDKIVAIMNQ